MLFNTYSEYVPKCDADKNVQPIGTPNTPTSMTYIHRVLIILKKCFQLWIRWMYVCAPVADMAARSCTFCKYHTFFEFNEEMENDDVPRLVTQLSHHC